MEQQYNKNSDKAKWFHSDCGIVFDAKGSWSYGNDLLHIFDLDNSSSFHSDNRNNDFLILGEGSKSLLLTLVTQIQNFA